MADWILVFLLIMLLGLISKLVDSTLGLGYGTMSVPVLLIVGYPIGRVVPAVLISEFLSAALTALFHAIQGNMHIGEESRDVRVSVVFSILGIIGAFVGVLIGVTMSELFVTVYVSITIIIVGTLVAQGFRWYFSWSKVTVFGFLAALNKGLSGGGYGPLVAGGQILSGRDGSRAIATTAVAESIVTAGSWLLYWWFGTAVLSFDSFMQLEIPLLIGSMISAPLSAYLIKVLPHKKTTRLIGIAAVILGIYTLGKTIFGDIISIIITLTIAIAVVVTAAVVTLRESQVPRQEESMQEDETLPPM